MTRVQARLATAFGLAAATALTIWACGGGGSSNPTGPSGGGGTGGTSQPTVTITASGVDPKEINIRSGQTVRFVNNDNRPHQMFTTPHLMHTDCPAINAVDNLSPGASKMTEALNVVRICGYHDHLNPDEEKFRGRINVDTTEGPAPGYIRP